jgi:RNA-directed DNA polymerase
MESALRREIIRHARAVIRRHEIKKWIARKHALSFTKRTGQQAIIRPLPRPPAWDLHPHFDPLYCIAHSTYLARTIWRKIEEGKYSPTPALELGIPKPNGELRQIMVFTVPDAAVAKLFRSRLTQRNAKLFSASTYAYRFDKNIFDALLQIEAAIKGEKVFIIQYDFRKYFDTISHQYLQNLIGSTKTFLTSKIERVLIRAFLIHRYADRESYVKKTFKQKDVG